MLKISLMLACFSLFSLNLHSQTTTQPFCNEGEALTTMCGSFNAGTSYKKNIIRVMACIRYVSLQEIRKEEQEMKTDCDEYASDLSTKTKEPLPTNVKKIEDTKQNELPAFCKTYIPPKSGWNSNSDITTRTVSVTGGAGLGASTIKKQISEIGSSCKIGEKCPGSEGSSTKIVEENTKIGPDIGNSYTLGLRMHNRIQKRKDKNLNDQQELLNKSIQAKLTNNPYSHYFVINKLQLSQLNVPIGAWEPLSVDISNPEKQSLTPIYLDLSKKKYCYDANCLKSKDTNAKFTYSVIMEKNQDDKLPYIVINYHNIDIMTGAISNKILAKIAMRDLKNNGDYCNDKNIYTPEITLRQKGKQGDTKITATVIGDTITNVEQVKTTVGQHYSKELSSLPFNYKSDEVSPSDYSPTLDLNNGDGPAIYGIKWDKDSKTIIATDKEKETNTETETTKGIK